MIAFHMMIMQTEDTDKKGQLHLSANKINIIIHLKIHAMIQSLHHTITSGILPMPSV